MQHGLALVVHDVDVAAVRQQELEYFEVFHAGSLVQDGVTVFVR